MGQLYASLNTGSVPAVLTLDPEMVLALFVAPVLLDAAYDASLRESISPVSSRRIDSWSASSSLREFGLELCEILDQDRADGANFRAIVFCRASSH